MTTGATTSRLFPLGFRGQPVSRIPIDMGRDPAASVDDCGGRIHVVGRPHSLHFAAGVAPFHTVEPIDRVDGMLSPKALTEGQIEVAVIQRPFSHGIPKLPGDLVNIHRKFRNRHRVRWTRHFEGTFLDQIHPNRWNPVRDAHFEPQVLAVSMGIIHGRIPADMLHSTRTDSPSYGTRSRFCWHFPGVPTVC